MRHGPPPDPRHRVRRATHAAVAIATLAPVVVLVYLHVLRQRLAAAGRSRILAGVVTVVLLATAVAPGPRAGAAATRRASSPAAHPAATATATPLKLLGSLDGSAEAGPDDAVRPAIALGSMAAAVRGSGSPAPSIVRFRPLDGATGVSRSANVSVRFTMAMDQASTQAAFRARFGDAPVAGTYSWAESDTVLVLDPASVLPYGAWVELSVDAGARSTGGAPLVEAGPVAFTVQPAPATGPAAPAARPAAQAAGSSAWRWPLSGPVTQYFGQSLTQYGFHYGIDIDGQTGDPVRATRAGKVAVAGRYDDCGGLEVHVDHGDGRVSWYRHLSRVDVAVGDLVAAGRVVGLVGDTGCSLGSHLHFAIRQGTAFVDPLPFLPAR